MGDKKIAACREREEPTAVVYIRAGQLCPNCGFARLVEEPGGRCGVRFAAMAMARGTGDEGFAPACGAPYFPRGIK